MKHVFSLGLLVLLCGCPLPPTICPVLETYDPAADVRRVRSESPFKLWNPTTMAEAGKILYVFSSSKAAKKYDLKTGRWSPVATIPEYGTDPRACALGGKIYLVGDGRLLLYDPAANAWTNLGETPVKFAAFGLTVLDGTIYVVGGSVPGSELATMYCFDPAEGRWSRKADLPGKRSDLVAQALDGKIYAVGGYHRVGEKKERRYGDEILVYDPMQDAWTEGPAFPDTFSRWGANYASAAIGGKLYVIVHKEDTTNVHAFDPDAGSWQTRSTRKILRRTSFGCAPRDGKLFFYGGLSRDYETEDIPGSDRKRIVFKP